MPLEDYKKTMQRCTRCSYCKWVLWDHMKSWRFAKGCPSIGFANFQAYSAGGRLSAALSLLEGRSEYTDGLVNVVYQCQMCGACDVACKICRYDMEPLAAMRELRVRLVEDGQLLPEHMPVIDNLRKEDNMMEMPKVERGNWSKGLDVKDLSVQKASVVFHAGCRCSYDADLQRVARSAVTVFKNAGVDIGIMGQSENCCGCRAGEMGYLGESIKYAENNIEAWENAGVETVVTSCADCYYGFKRIYPRYGSKFQVLHTSEFIEQLIAQGKIKFNNKLPMTVTYHDPCHLGRQGEPYVPWTGHEKKILGQMVVHEPKKPRYNGIHGVYDAPRNVLASIPGIKLVEMERIKEYAWCCGAGGGVREAYPDFSTWTSQERIEEAKSTGAQALVTACPWCERNFMDVLEHSKQPLKVFDIIDLVRQAM